MALELPKFSKKDKTSGGVAGGAKNDIVLKFTDFFEKNPWMKIVIPIVLFLILVIVFVFAILGDGVLTGDNEAGVDATAPSNEVQIIPDNNVIKDKEIVELIKQDPLSEDILASASYTGSVKGSSGLKTALIQIGSSNDTLTLSIGETVGDSEWELTEIYNDYVIFKAGELTKKLNLT